MTTRRKHASEVGAPPDEIREKLLQFLYEHHRRARGVQAQELGLRELQHAMKERHGFSQQEVASNLDYLVQRGWVREIRRERTFTTPAGTVRPREQVTYKISDAGIDHVEGESRFKRLSPYGGVNIGNVQDVVVVGDRNVVHNEFVALSNALEELRKAIAASNLPEAEKVEVIAEIQTVQSQLAKQTPNRSIIQAAWSTVERIATVGGVVELMERARQSIAPFLS